ncbi:MAG: TlpA family protein disulfide reductase [Bryobacteraceae bacterium]|nr:TlpA family protein disulfide reductase [Bryobacteraceae bacterium]
MRAKMLAVVLGTAGSVVAAIVPEVRAAAMKGDFAAGEKIAAEFKKSNGVTGEYVEAFSWLGRGALAAKQYEKAIAYADQTRAMSLELLKTRKLDDEKRLPIGFGASIEVHGQAMAGQGRRTEAIAFLQKELAEYRGTSIRTRIQKNIHLLSLEGKPVPSIEIAEWLGAKPSPVTAMKGKPVVLFFWAHWCGDCKFQGPILARLRKENPGLAVMMPTQRYGYGQGGADATPAEELKYIDAVRKEFYGELLDAPAPVSEENFKAWGSSTTPTLVLVDKKGIVRLYHPGRLTYEELAPKVRALLGS